VVATAAPLIVSVVLFIVTRSAFTLVFAALGPVVAVASSIDAKLAHRRLSKREAARFASEVARASAAIDAAHAAERAELGASSPAVASLIEQPSLIPGLWRRSVPGRIALHVGSGTIASTLVYGRAADDPTLEPDSEIEATLSGLRARASRLERAAVTVSTATGIGVVGPPTLAAAFARGLVLQLAASLSPEEWLLGVGADAKRDWMRMLPHALGSARSMSALEFSNGGHSIAIVSARSPAELPRDLDVVLQLAADATTVVDRITVVPEFVGEEQAAELASAMTALAGELGFGAAGAGALPEVVEFDALAPVSAVISPLGSSFGVTAEGPLSLDLVSQGPHAIVGGTTGSGKSELLVSWVLGMAAERPPSAVTFLFVDFKGGASFGSLTDLPHSVGVLTDLDTAQCLRALASLGAELRYRERALADAGLRSVDDTPSPPFPRLVVVVDEYAALVETFPALHAAFADIAARGRSLGVHLVLCTQRPAGVVRDGILANCALRLSLRVTSAADSTAVLGTDAAALLAARPLGRALVSVAGDAPRPFQVARSSPADIARVVGRWASAPHPRPPWLPPLPHRLDPSAVEVADPGDDLPFALIDLPGEQAQRVLRYRPAEHGSLFVVGAAGAGKSGVVAALAAARTSLEISRVPGEIARMWDVLVTAVESPRGAERVLLFDDIDVTIAGCADSHRDALVDLLARLLREGPAVGIFCVLTAQRPGGALHGLATLCASRLVLRMTDRADHALAGGDGEYVANLPPGSGHWHGDLVQVVLAPTPHPESATPRAVTVDAATEEFAVVSPRPQAMAERLRELAPGRPVVVIEAPAFGMPRDEVARSPAGEGVILVADADAWQSQWAVFGPLQRSRSVLFDGCSLAEFRALTRSRELPPPFPRGERALWIRTPDAEVNRARLTGSIAR
jgi:S-DNA-T family DNA segregation ATPase FtsK/SpoIIIE